MLQRVSSACIAGRADRMLTYATDACHTPPSRVIVEDHVGYASPHWREQDRTSRGVGARVGKKRVKDGQHRMLPVGGA